MARTLYNHHLQDQENPPLQTRVGKSLLLLARRHQVVKSLLLLVVKRRLLQLAVTSIHIVA
jgi:hypothetical protein